MSSFRNSSNEGIMVFLLRLLSPHKKWVAGSLIATIISISATIALAVYTKQLVNQTVDNSLSTITVTVFIAVVTITAFVGGASGFISRKIGALTGNDLKKKIADHMMQADYRHVKNLSSGDAVSTLNHDAGQIAHILSNDFFTLFTQLLTAICGFVYLLYLHPLVALLSFAYTPIGMILANKINKKMGELFPVSNDQKGEILDSAEQAFSSISVIKAYNYQPQIKRKMDTAFRKVYENDMRIKFWDALLQPACLVLANTPMLVFSIAGGYYAFNGKLDFGSFVAITQLMYFIIPPTVMLPFMLNNLYRLVASIKRVNKIVNLMPSEGLNGGEVIEKTNRRPNYYSTSISIELDHMSFGYDPESQILKNISFKVKGPGITAIVGASGEGKTTMLSVISGLFRPNQGNIIINGQNTNQLSESEISEYFSILPQEIHVFAESIYENIRVGKYGANQEEIAAAARAAGFYDYVLQKADKWECKIGDGGDSLSGGQAQKLAFARAFLKDAPIWLMDEPTSALDKSSEEHIHELIQEVSEKKMMLIIAHRLSTIKIAKRIIFMKNGMVSAIGTWEELKQNEEFLKTVNSARNEDEVEALPL